MNDFSKILSQAKELETKMKESQEKIKNITVEGISGTNSVKVILNGEGEVIKIDISPETLKEEKAIIEDLINEISQEFSIVIVTHSMAQAARVSNKTAFFHLGKLIEVGPTKQIFTNPSNEKTQNYITGRIG